MTSGQIAWTIVGAVVFGLAALTIRSRMNRHTRTAQATNRYKSRVVHARELLNRIEHDDLDALRERRVRNQ